MIDLSLLKNDAERLAFLDDYGNRENGWYIWKVEDDMQRMLWRFDLPQDTAGGAIIVEEELRTYMWPEWHRKWTIKHWYIIKDWSNKEKTFADQVASRTLALNLIKDVQKQLRSGARNGRQEKG